MYVVLIGGNYSFSCLFERFRYQLSPVTDISVYQVFTVAPDIADIVKTSSSKTNPSSLKKMVIGRVPDRGGGFIFFRWITICISFLLILDFDCFVLVLISLINILGRVEERGMPMFKQRESDQPKPQRDYHQQPKQGFGGRSRGKGTG